MKLPPLPQQVIASQFLVDHREALLLLEPGLGKTRSCLDATEFMTSDLDVRGTLILSPKRVSTLTWPAELKKWQPNAVYANLRTEEGMRMWDKGEFDYALLNYDMVPKLAEHIRKRKRPVHATQLVLDECHRLRDPSGVRQKKLFGIREHFDRFVGLTGSPTPNSPLDLFNQVKMMDGGKTFGTSFSAFRNRYATPDYLGYTWTLHDDAEEAIYAKAAHMCLVMKSEDWLDIPPVSIQDIEINLPFEAAKQYKLLQKEMLLTVKKQEVVASTAAVLIGKLRQFTSGASYCYEEDESRGVVHLHDAKIQALKKLHDGMGREPLLVMTQYKHESDRIKAAMPYAREFDESKIADWDAGKIPMWFAHPASIGVGLNLQKSCCKICWLSGTYSSDDFLQTNCRVARTGQTKPTTIYRIIVKDSVDEAMIEAVRNKVNGQNGAMESLHNLRLLAESA